MGPRAHRRDARAWARPNRAAPRARLAECVPRARHPPRPLLLMRYAAGTAGATASESGEGGGGEEVSKRCSAHENRQQAAERTSGGETVRCGRGDPIGETIILEGDVIIASSGRALAPVESIPTDVLPRSSAVPGVSARVVSTASAVVARNRCSGDSSSRRAA